ncbi:hypothetical protein EYF80_030870 [Liparis tanakae]|uniref:Uncharacterized protein n=1 Tax=Liparis tanakae TaxID=230148 RepID=A0A4Z2GZA2_9TELE|nr:hypothetical protein EYF80_030870 [Liparis tanakae]
MFVKQFFLFPPVGDVSKAVRDPAGPPEGPPALEPALAPSPPPGPRVCQHPHRRRRPPDTSAEHGDLLGPGGRRGRLNARQSRPAHPGTPARRDFSTGRVPDPHLPAVAHQLQLSNSRFRERNQQGVNSHVQHLPHANRR